MNQPVNSESNPDGIRSTGRCPVCHTRLNIIDANINGAGTTFECRTCSSKLRKVTTGRGAVILAFMLCFGVSTKYGYISAEFAFAFIFAVLAIALNQTYRSVVEAVHEAT